MSIEDRIELLLSGVPIERVSILLGHTSVRITEKHYAPWVRARQEQLEADLTNAWSRDPFLLAQTQGTGEDAWEGDSGFAFIAVTRSQASSRLSLASDSPGRS
jgi:hypothetical protein